MRTHARTAQDTEDFGGRLARSRPAPDAALAVLYLTGEPRAGKTTFAARFVAALAWQGAGISPAHRASAAIPSIRKTCCEVFGAGLLGVRAVSLSGAAELRGIHLSTSADSAQVTLDLTEGATHKLFTLEHPDRVVIDLSQTHLASEVRAPAVSGGGTDGRSGSHPDGTLRLVVQLKSALAAHTARAPGEEGRQLVLTLGQPAQPPPEVAP